ncbi:GNAT family N-acetyltransferase [Tatumella ptyseos]|uniref:GNAT family N-acetyltransferase n=1 Tax=Tatumella ptyseos TaxID=82987 RepID=UPI0026F29294|nr:GNAT family N-acetyltransferase [Tatumella ptyseos]WKX26149.1 GNAT family N-acetyltransferase [Tatumella ptyseos]
MQLETERLLLRQWQTSDLIPFQEMNQDPEVMRFFMNPLSAAQSDELAKKFRLIIQRKGWGFWAVELKSTAQFIGFCGLHEQPNKFSFSPCVEIGWRFSSSCWSQGLATEAAERVLQFAFENLSLQQVVAFTSVHNHRSERLMQRLNMTRQRTFKHPHIPAEHPLAEHLLYALQRSDFLLP